MKTIKFVVCLIANIILFSYQNTYAQISKGGIPYSFTEAGLKDSVSIVKMPFVNVDSLLLADITEREAAEPFRFGYAIDVNIGLKKQGTWDTLTDGSKIWRLKIYSKDAYSINLIFDEFWLPKGAQFFVYNEDRSMILGAFTSEVSNNEYNKFATDLIKGSTLVLEYYEPAYVDGGVINIDKIIHGYVNTFSGHGSSSNCNIDVSCSQGDEWCIEKRAVSMILLDDNTRLCSGCLINNVRQDLTPYYLTANHCLRGDENTWVFRFKYWSPTCNQGEDATSWVSIAGATVRANWSGSDFALLELNAPPPSGFGVMYAGWSNQNVASPSGVSITHPQGDVMKIGLYNQTITRQTFLGSSDWRVVWNQGTVEPGSSGGPLFNNNHLLIGQVHGGNPADICTSNDHAFFGRFDVSWTGGGTSSTRLSNWLDPDNTGATTIEATSPTIYLINRTLTGTNKFASLEKLHIEGEVNTNGVLCQPSNIPFTTEYGSNSTFVAKSITIYPGTEFKLGSNVVVEAKNNITCNNNIVEGDYVDVFCNAQISMLATDNDIIEQYHDESFIEYNDSQNDDNIIAHPNPNDGNLVVEFIKTEDSEPSYFKSIIITDLSGRIVYRGTDMDENKNYIDISESPKGVYLMYIETNKKSFIKKIMVK